MVKQTKDDGGALIALLGYSTKKAYTLTYNSSTANALVVANTAQIITITPTTSCYIEFSANAAPATSASHYFIGGIPYDVSLGQDPRHNTISVLSTANTGILYVSERA